MSSEVFEVLQIGKLYWNSYFSYSLHSPNGPFFHAWFFYSSHGSKLLHIFGKSVPGILMGSMFRPPSNQLKNRPPQCKQQFVTRPATSSDCSENPFRNKHKCPLLARYIFCQYQNILVHHISFVAIPKKPSDCSEHDKTQ